LKEEDVHLDLKLKRAIEAIQHRATAGHLGYLALTSKCELPVRDLIATQLHDALAPEGLLVGREVAFTGNEKKDYRKAAERLIRRMPVNLQQEFKTDKGELGGEVMAKGPIDLVVFDQRGEKAQLLLELKAMYTFDWNDQKGSLNPGMRRGIQLDVLRSRCAAAALGLSVAYVLVLTFHVSARTGEASTCDHLSRILKYDLGSKVKSTPADASLDALSKFMEREICSEDVFAVEAVQAMGTIDCGSAFELHVHMRPWLFRTSRLR
jgi:hypothetical protein